MRGLIRKAAESTSRAHSIARETSAGKVDIGHSAAKEKYYKPKSIEFRCSTIVMGDFNIPEVKGDSIFEENPLIKRQLIKIEVESKPKKPLKKDPENKSEMMLVSNSLLFKGRKRRK